MLQAFNLLLDARQGAPDTADYFFGAAFPRPPPDGTFGTLLGRFGTTGLFMAPPFFGDQMLPLWAHSGKGSPDLCNFAKRMGVKMPARGGLVIDEVDLLGLVVLNAALVPQDGQAKKKWPVRLTSCKPRHGFPYGSIKYAVRRDVDAPKRLLLC